MGRKKNKKSFSSNLESLFEQRLLEDNAQDKPSMFKKEKKKKDKKAQEKGNTAAKAKKKKRKSKRKSFSKNLESFFKESLDGVMDGVVTEVKRRNIKKGNKKGVGLDLLIKRTTAKNVSDSQQPKISKTQTKRVTVVLDTQKIEELKKIAKQQKRPLYKLVAEVVEEFLDKGQEE